MVHRGRAVEWSGPARSERGPRRAAPTGFRFKASHWDSPMPPSRKVTALGGGRYRVTTITEQEVSAEQLSALGLQVPPEDVPWVPEPSRVVHAAERASALQYWSKLLGGYDPRLSERMVVFLREFSLEDVLAAIDQVAATNPKGGVGAKYAQFIRVLRELRARGAR